MVKPSAVDCFQVRSVFVDRLVSQVGSVNMDIITQVQEAVMKVIGAM